MRALLLLSLLAVFAPPLGAQPITPPALDEALQTVASDLWPGFDARTIPLAVYDGTQTWLFRHPAPPEGFQPGLSGAFVWPGRHPAMLANTSAEIGGVMTATVLLDRVPAARPLREVAALALHEAFHVYQRRAHATWTGNEADLFVYPDTDAGLLALAEQERRALHRALQAPHARAACEARAALARRAERYGRMAAAFRAYERSSELNEGLATYVEARAAHRTPASVVATPFEARAVRDRAYHTGPALAFLLDRFAWAWRDTLNVRDTLALDVLLLRALPAGLASCAPPAAESEAVQRDAAASVAALQRERARVFAAFERQPGTRLVIEAAAGHPLWPQNFDPLNVRRDGPRVLHTRTVRVGNEAGAISVLDRAALTVGAGAHPLFNGIARAEVGGLVRPEVMQAGDTVTVRAPGVEARFTGARVTHTGAQFVVTLH